MTRTMVLSGTEQRRSWRDALRREIVFEAFQPGAIVLERYDFRLKHILSS